MDSGQLMVVDPCYLEDWGGTDFVEKEGDTSFSYSGACNVTLSARRFGQLDHGAVVSSSGYGDGCYPVYAEINEDGRVMRLVVEMGDDEPRGGADKHDACPVHEEAYRLCGCPVPS